MPLAVRSRKILMVNLTNIAEGEGGALHQLSLARCFRELGHGVRVVAPARPVRDSLSADGGDLVSLSASLSRLGLPGSFDALPQIPLLIWYRLAQGFDLLYVRANMLTWLLALVARALGMTVVVEHNSWLPTDRISRGGPPWLAKLEGAFQVWSARLANRSRVVTKGIKRLLEGRGVAPEKIVVVGNGTDVRRFRPLERAEALEAGVLDPAVTRLGFIGILAPWQGVETAIRAFALMEPGPTLRLVIAGDGPERPRLVSLAEELGIAGQVHFLGYVPKDKANIVINSFDIALAPFTRCRNAEIGLSPIKIRDYAAAGRLVVCSRIPELEELAEHGWMILHEPDDPADLARVLTDCLTGACDRAAAGRRARAYAMAHFAWGSIAQQVARDVLQA